MVDDVAGEASLSAVNWIGLCGGWASEVICFQWWSKRCPYIPAESVYAVVEVKPKINKTYAD